jgi:hypothetical protein
MQHGMCTYNMAGALGRRRRTFSMTGAPAAWQVLLVGAPDSWQAPLAPGKVCGRVRRLLEADVVPTG